MFSNQLQSNDQEETGLVLLAAGSSSRLKRPKQLLRVEGKTLLQHCVEVALEVTKKVVVVLGAYADDIKKELEGLPVHISFNQQYEEGIASSIRSGLSHLLEVYPDTDNVLLLVCDQPYLSKSLLVELIAKRQTTQNFIIASAYNNTIGTPALFHKNYFTPLLTLKGDVGAKKLMKQHSEDVALVPFPMGYVDIDTEEDYNSLKK